MTDELNLDPLFEVLWEARGLAEGIIKHWQDTFVSDPNGLHMYGQFGIRRHRRTEFDGAQWRSDIWDESEASFRERIIQQFREILTPVEVRSKRGLRRWMICPRNNFRGKPEPVTAAALVACYAAEFSSVDQNMRMLVSLFGGGVTHDNEVLALAQVMENAGRLAREMLAEGGPISDEYKEVLRMWREISPHDTLRFHEVGQLFCEVRGIKKLPAQCNEPGKFLTRFARKLGDQGTRAPWVLHDSAKTRKL
jgi:hypothetical protein